MPRLSSSALARSSEFLLSINSTHDLAELSARISAGLSRLVTCDRASLNEARMNDGLTTVRPTPLPDWWPRLGAVYEHHASDHPCMNPRIRPPLLRTISLSDPRYAATWNKSVLKHEYFIPLGVDHQLCIIYYHQGRSLVAAGINRQRRAFSRADRLVTDLVNPHIAQAWGNALAVTALRAGPGEDPLAGSRTIVAVSADRGTLRSLSPGASRMLRRYFDADTAGSARLPEPLGSWLRAQRTRLHEFDPAAPPSSPLVVRRPARRLTVRMVRVRPDESLLLLEDIHAVAPRGPLAGLSPRENEILGWITEGKRNTEIATILTISPRTVEKHVERILEKLGVETRAAAVRHFFASSHGPHA